jgi:hypothetical protein
MERLGSQNPNDFYLLTGHSFRAVGEQDQGGNSRRTTSRNPRITAHFGRRLADQALKQGSDPDEARRARGEADFLTRRALKLAPDNDEIKKLRDEVVQVIKLNSH